MIQIFKTLWTDDHPHFEGEFYHFRDIGFAPKPVQKPHPPIWIGGHSRAAFERVVALGDGWHASALSPEQMRPPGGVAPGRRRRRATFDQLKLSLRLKLRWKTCRARNCAITDQYCATSGLGLSHLALDFRREDLSEMLDTLALVADEIRPLCRQAETSPLPQLPAGAGRSQVAHRVAAL